MAALADAMKAAFVHPSLGLGGAERWVVDAALELQRRGHEVRIFTAELDPKRCFDAVRDGRVAVTVNASRLPANIGGRLRAPGNVARTAALTWLERRALAGYDVIVADLISHSLPWLRRWTGRPAVFYVHFPDRLLTPPRRGLYALYRRPIDALEERGLRAADAVLVNSRFTAGEYQRIFPGLPAPAVLYPGVERLAYAAIPPPPADGPIRLLSINRFDPNKNLGLAIEMLADLRKLLQDELFTRVKLQLAGGLDDTRWESVREAKDLEALAAAHGLAEQVEILPNPSDTEVRDLLAGARCVVYTAREEHLGLVPVEAMAAGRPVVAVAQGGPLETIVEGSTGRLRPPEGREFAEAVADWVRMPGEAADMGRRGRERAAEFSRARFGAGLEAALEAAIENAA